MTVPIDMQGPLSHEHQLIEESYSEKFSKRKKRILMNLVELAIGIILLVVCFNYLKSHPAEKLSVFSSIETLVQKGKVIVSQWTTGKGGDLKVKYSLERSYKEMLHIVEDTNCLDPIQREEIRRMYTRLQEVGVEEFASQEELFVTFLSLTYTKVQEQCDLDE